MTERAVQRIFVQIAAYRDPELLPTIADCLARAADPRRLTFGICWQRDESETLGAYARDARFRIVEVDYRHARGPCWARHRIQRLYDGEAYTVHLDSHHRFVEGWDAHCIDMMRDLQRGGSAKPLLTTYAPPYQPQTDPVGREPVPFRLRFRRFAAEGLVEVLPETMDDFLALDAPIPARFFSAHFAFTLGRFCEEVPHDPKLYFFGEEPTLAVRSFTHGYDLFHPHRIILWHHYGRDDLPKHWGDHALWPFHNERSMQRVRQLLRIDETPCAIDFGAFGLGAARSLRDYEVYAGMHFGVRGVSDHALQNRPPPDPAADAEDPQWARRFFRRQSFSVHLAPSDVAADVADVDFWYVGAHTADGAELFRHDLHGAELDHIRRRVPYEQEFFFHSPQFPASWTVWPHSRSRGWLDKVTRAIAG